MEQFQMKPFAPIPQRKPQQESSSPLGGALGSLLGGLLLAPLGPLGIAAGSTLGGSLGGKGDLSGVTPEALAFGALTANLPGIKDVVGGAKEGVTAAATDAATDAAADAALSTAADAAVTGATDSLGGALQQQASANLGKMAAPTIGEAGKKSIFDSVSGFLNPSAESVAEAATNGFIEKPKTYLDHMANKVKSSFFEEGGYVGRKCNCGPMAKCNCK